MQLKASGARRDWLEMGTGPMDGPLEGSDCEEVLGRECCLHDGWVFLELVLRELR